MRMFFCMLVAVVLLSAIAHAAEQPRTSIAAGEDPFLNAVAELKDPALEEAIIQAVADLFAERYGQANTAFENILSLHGESKLGTALREQLTLMNGFALGGVGDYDKAMGIYDALLESYGGMDGTERRDDVCSLLSLKIDVLEMSGDDDARLEAIDAMLAAFIGDEEPMIRWRVDMALHAKAQLLKKRGDRGGAVAVFRQYRDRLVEKGDARQRIDHAERQIAALLAE